MSDLNTFTELLKAVSNIGISVSEKTRKFVAALNEGIEIDDESGIIETTSGLYDIAPNGDVLKIAIFINQRNARRHPSQDGTQKWHKFHLFRCSTIDNYPVSRKYRYKKKQTMTKVYFSTLLLITILNINQRKECEAENYNYVKTVKMNYLPNLNSFSVSNFPIKDFFKHIPKSNISGTFEYDHDQVPIFYSREWDKIARKLKDDREWRCEQCYIDLSTDKKFLHAHHMDGNPSNNSIANIKALCIYCHSKQVLHEHVQRLPDYDEFIRKYKH